MKIYHIEQGSPEWFDIRKGKLTASKAQAIASNGKGLETLCYELLAEKYSSAVWESYSNEDMERGKLLEEQAREMYELETGNKIEIIGFVETDEYTGCSPDGFIGKDGLIEIKCKKDTTYFRAIIEEKIDTGYEWQVQMQLLLTGRKFVDFVDYCPNYKKSINITRIKADKDMQDKITKGLEAGRKMLKEIEKKYLTIIS
jgi:putative phage-type endonuclease